MSETFLFPILSTDTCQRNWERSKVKCIEYMKYMNIRELTSVVDNLQVMRLAQLFFYVNCSSHGVRWHYNSKFIILRIAYHFYIAAELKPYRISHGEGNICKSSMGGMYETCNASWSVCLEFQTCNSVHPVIIGSLILLVRAGALRWTHAMTV